VNRPDEPSDDGLFADAVVKELAQNPIFVEGACCRIIAYATQHHEAEAPAGWIPWTVRLSRAGHRDD
jgi:hypothetical protein